MKTLERCQTAEIRKLMNDIMKVSSIIQQQHLENTLLHRKK